MNHKILAVTIVSIAATAGCNNKTLYFGTHSSIGLDVSGTSQVPDHVSLAYSRYEGAYVPPKTGTGNETGHSVFGGIDADMSFFGPQVIKQTFATGNAAIAATSLTPLEVEKKEKVESTKKVDESNCDDPKPLLFTTSTTFGLDLRAGDTEIRPKAVLGYKRSEAAYIPIRDLSQEVRSVYADLEINTTTKSNAVGTNFSAVNGVRLKQQFATGLAAVQLTARNKNAKQKLYEAAGIKEAVSNLITAEEEKAAQILEHTSDDGQNVNAEKWNALIKGPPLESGAKLSANVPIADQRKKLLHPYSAFLDQLIANIN